MGFFSRKNKEDNIAIGFLDGTGSQKGASNQRYATSQSYSKALEDIRRANENKRAILVILANFRLQGRQKVEKRAEGLGIRLVENATKKSLPQEVHKYVFSNVCDEVAFSLSFCKGAYMTPSVIFLHPELFCDIKIDTRPAYCP
ncbi:MAG TPA: hypothetical protein IGQ44_03475 [Geminocystis sp. M7585_C2015_104]|nr:hypothetical protein [Geminocystis sp. M7585_C2015_104]